MPAYRSSDWKNLAIGRAKRRDIAGRAADHPYAHVDPDKRYDWMRTDCAALELARQGREDGLISTITQISSAAFLGIPGFIFSKQDTLPTLASTPLLYLGLLGFMVALAFALFEQYLSGLAYKKQVDITRKYYQLESKECDDPIATATVRRCRNIACILFLLAVIISAIALVLLKGTPDGKSSSAATAATPSATAAPSSSSSAAPAITANQDRRGPGSEVGSAVPAATAEKAVNQSVNFSFVRSDEMSGGDVTYICKVHTRPALNTSKHQRKKVGRANTKSCPIR